MTNKPQIPAPTANDIFATIDRQREALTGEPAYTHYGYPVHEYNDNGTDPGNCSVCHTFHK